MRDYTIPKEITHFFDFYATHELYLRCGGFREEGYAMYNLFVNESIYIRILDTYDCVIESFFNNIKDSLEETITDEIENFIDECYDVNNIDKISKLGYTDLHVLWPDCYLDKNPYLIYRIFNDFQWNHSYAGKKWAVATQCFIDIKDVKTITDKVLWCDRVLDLYHNTGHILNKTKYECLSQNYWLLDRNKSNKKRPISALNFRAKARSVMEFVPYVSPSVRKLLIPILKQ